MSADKQDSNESVTDYLSSLVWDGTPRLERRLIDYAGGDYTVQEARLRTTPDLSRKLLVKT